MSNPGDADDRPITDVRDLAEYFASGAKPPAEWTIGTEHEAFGFGLTGFAPVSYTHLLRAGKRTRQRGTRGGGG